MARLGGTPGPSAVDGVAVVTNGIVITVDASRRVICAGSVAIDGRDIVAVDTAAAIAAGFAAARRSTPPARSSCPA